MTTLRKLRRDSGLTQYQAARRAGLSLVAYQRYENGIIRLDERIRAAIAKVLGVSADDLMQ